MSERLDTLNRNCPAMRYLRNVIRAAINVSESNAEQIMVHDGVERHFYDANEKGVFAAARWALEIDGDIVIRVHRATFRVMYDALGEGYTMADREEIIIDCNERGGEIIDSVKS